MNIGVLQQTTGRPDEALKWFGKALPIWQKLAQDFPDSVETESNLGSIYVNTGALQAVTGKSAEAKKSYDSALEIWRKLTDAHPTVTAFQDNLASTHMNIAFLQEGAEALESLEKAAAIWKTLVDAHPTVTAFRSNLSRALTIIAGTQHNMAQTMRSKGDKDGALALFQKAWSSSESAVRADGANVQAQMNLALHHSAMGQLRKETGKPAEAVESYLRAAAVRKRIADENPADLVNLNSMAEYHNEIGILETGLGKRAEAMASYEQARAIWDRLTREHPDSPDFACGLAGVLSNMAELNLNAKRFEEARSRLRRAITLQKKALATAPGHPRCRAYLAVHLDVLIKADKELGRAEEAAVARRALEDLNVGFLRIAALDARLSELLKGDAP
jgi:tetratricopeptide (TPR) repeat protein